MKPTVSVLMRVYNGGTFLLAALESILNQTFDNFELIVINDGSTDRTPDILEDYARQDGRLQVFSQPNSGNVVALNRAWQIAVGEYVARMDADDVALPDRFEKQIKFCMEHPDISVVGGAIETMNRQGELIELLHFPTEHADPKEDLAFSELPCSSDHHDA